SDEGRQTVAKGRILGANDLRWISIDVRCAHLHPHWRRGIESADRQSQHTSGFHSRTEDFILMIGGLDAIDAPPYQVDQTVRTIQFPSPRSQSPGIPTLHNHKNFGQIGTVAT